MTSVKLLLPQQLVLLKVHVQLHLLQQLKHSLQNKTVAQMFFFADITVLALLLSLLVYHTEQLTVVPLYVHLFLIRLHISHLIHCFEIIALSLQWIVFSWLTPYLIYRHDSDIFHSFFILTFIPNKKDVYYTSSSSGVSNVIFPIRPKRKSCNIISATLSKLT